MPRTPEEINTAIELLGSSLNAAKRHSTRTGTLAGPEYHDIVLTLGGHIDALRWVLAEPSMLEGMMNALSALKAGEKMTRTKTAGKK